jgi:N-acetylglutamate synthase-like GNAT family acetyltransferase
LIREAVKEDIPKIIEMGSRSIQEGPYKELLPDRPEVTQQLARKLLEMPNAKILAGECDGKVVAVFAFILFDHYYSGEFVAGEMIWYVEPEARKSSMGLELLWAAEKLASSMGAKKMQLTAPTDEIANLYAHLRGYQKVETAFQRNIECR